MTATLVPRWIVGEVDLTSYPYSVDADDGVAIGEPELIVEEIPADLADGEDVRGIRHGNRTYVIPVFIEGPTLGDLAVSEARLRHQLNRASRGGLELLHDPGDGLVPASVYPVHLATMTPERSDKHESHLIRRWVLTLTCSPFAQSADPVTVEAMPIAATVPTLIDDCSSTAGWTATVDGVGTAPTVAGGALSAEDSTSPKMVQLRRAGEVVFGSQRYLIAEVETNASALVLYAAVAGKSVQFLPTATRRLSSGWVQYVFDTSGATVSDMTFVVEGEPIGLLSPPARLRINNLSMAASAPQVSPRQTARIIVPGGTERTPASIHVMSDDGSSPNGMTIVHTSPARPDGFSPDLTRWRVSGNTSTPNTNTFSGKTEPIHPSPFVSRLPVQSVAMGGYLLCAAMKSSVVGTFPINWAVDTIVAGSPQGQVTDFEQVQFYAADEWQFCSIALETLPTVQSADGEVSVVLWYQGAAATITLDEAWLFPVDDDSALTVVNAASAHLWLDSPSVTTGSQPRVWTGNAADRSDARHPGAYLFAPGNHVLHSEGTTVFVGTRGADNPAVDSTHYMRWHSNAAQ